MNRLLSLNFLPPLSALNIQNLNAILLHFFSAIDNQICHAGTEDYFLREHVGLYEELGYDVNLTPDDLINNIGETVNYLENYEFNIQYKKNEMIMGEQKSMV